ncbi:tyrosine-type recombinase/integrase [Alistipes sp. OttesenSCG-928-L06]|nr:tyrosine-type recombinase/integrase [Alistipes sp. OttesenSCG-928-L06]
MLKHLFPDPVILSKHLEAPFVDERERYLVHLKSSKRLKDASLQIVARILLDATKLYPPGKEVISLDEIDRMADKWNKIPGYKGRPKEPYRFIYHVTDWLLWCNMVNEPHVDSVPIFNEIIGHRAVRKPHIFAPHLIERIAYLEKCKQGGFDRRELQKIAKHLLRIIKYLKFNELRLVSLSEINKAGRKWATEDNVIHRPEKKVYKYAELDFIRTSKQWLSFIGCLEIELQTFPFKEYLDEYARFQQEEKGFSISTIKGSYSVMKLIFTNVGQQCSRIEDITPQILDDVLVGLLKSGRYTRRSIAHYTSRMRDFFKYAEQNNWCRQGLSGSIYSPRIYTHENIPYAPQWSEIKKIIEIKSTDRPTDIRDCAILQLIAVYGLRCGEVVNLQLKDIDWRKETIHIRRGKGGKPQTFPLMPTVGKAILNYIQKSRQNESGSKYLFLCRDSPYRPMSNGVIYLMVSTALKSIGAKLKHYGPHSIRHGCATRLINEGISLKQIGDQFGHQRLDTTRVYAKVDLKNLRKVAQMDWGTVL